MAQEKTVFVGYTCSEHSDHQLKFDKDAGKRNKDATPEADIFNDDQSMELPTKTASVESGTTVPNGNPPLTSPKERNRAKKGKHSKRSASADDSATEVGVPSNSRGSRGGVGKRNVNKKQVVLQKIQDSEVAKLRFTQKRKSVKNLKPAEGDSKDISLALDQHPPAKNADDTAVESDFE
jgi:hypothetical protein